MYNVVYGMSATLENLPSNVRPTKTPISLRIRAFWSESSLSAWRNCILGYPKGVKGRFRSDCANAQADLNLRWRTCPKVRFLTMRFVCLSCRNSPCCIVITQFTINFRIFYFRLILQKYEHVEMSKTAGWPVNSVEPDQTPRSAASDLDQRYFPGHISSNT